MRRGLRTIRRSTSLASWNAIGPAAGATSAYLDRRDLHRLIITGGCDDAVQSYHELMGKVNPDGPFIFKTTFRTGTVSDCPSTHAIERRQYVGRAPRRMAASDMRAVVSSSNPTTSESVIIFRYSCHLPDR
jgi:hypothetical protein